MKHFSLLLVILTLSACATQAEKDSQVITRQFTEAIKEAENCWTEVEKRNPKAEKVIDKYGFGDSATLEQRLNESYLSEAEKDLILDARKDSEICIELATNLVPQSLPSPFSSYALKTNTDYIDKIDDSLISLLKNEITVGEHASNKKEYRTELEQRWNEIGAMLDQWLINRHNAELSRQAAAWNNFVKSTQARVYRPQTLNNCYIQNNYIYCN